MSMMRSALLMASENVWLRERAPRYRFIRRTVERFLPGEKLDDALAAAERLAENRIDTLLTHLGENVTMRAEAESIARHYLEVIDRLRGARLSTEISVKLTQLGLDIDREFCCASLLKLIEHWRAGSAPPQKVVWIDMEQSPYVDVTLDLFRRVRKSHPNVGVCLQAYLYRSERDLESLIALGAAVRLVKGAYNEPSEIAYPQKGDVDESYFRMAQRLLSPEARRLGVRAALATHDVKLIARLCAWAAARQIPKHEIEFAMLYGIQRSEQLRLAREGYRCSVLISYGSFWFPWFMRRLAERPANVFFLARNFLGG